MLSVGALSTLRETTIDTDQYELESLLSGRFVLSWRQMSVVGVVCALFLLISFTPLTSHTTWSLATRGEAILATGSLPTADVTQSLSQGLPVHETAWLSSISWALIARQSFEAITWATTILASISLITIAVSLWLRTRNSLFTGAGILWFAVFAWGSLGLGSATLLVLPLWITLILLTLKDRWAPSIMTAIVQVALIVLWANFDASVFVGVGFLVCVAIGNAVQLLVEHHFQSKPLLADRRFQISLITAEIAIVATLFTPLGTGLWTDLWQNFSIMGTLLDFITPIGACWVVLFAAIGILIAKRSDNRVLVESGAVAVFGLLALLAADMIVWLGPLAALVLIPRLQQALSIGADPVAAPSMEEPDGKPPVLRFAYSLGAVLLIWIVFALSPLSGSLLGREPRAIGNLFKQEVPLAATAYLRKNPVEGRVFAPAIWGDLLRSEYGGQADVFATSSMKNLPQQAKYDYNRITRGESIWQEASQRYNIDALVVDKTTQSAMLETIREPNENWHVGFEDDRSLVLRRNGS
ncbi:hypothetical protein GCM10023155_42420 [Bremerella cremea]